jgi:hypothetical protein
MYEYTVLVRYSDMFLSDLIELRKVGRTVGGPHVLYSAPLKIQRPTKPPDLKGAVDTYSYLWAMGILY